MAVHLNNANSSITRSSFNPFDLDLSKFHRTNVSMLIYLFFGM